MTCKVLRTPPLPKSEADKNVVPQGTTKESSAIHVNTEIGLKAYVHMKHWTSLIENARCFKTGLDNTLLVLQKVVPNICTVASLFN